jgi:hypothetical protein
VYEEYLSLSALIMIIRISAAAAAAAGLVN